MIDIWNHLICLNMKDLPPHAGTWKVIQGEVTINNVLYQTGDSLANTPPMLLTHGVGEHVLQYIAGEVPCIKEYELKFCNIRETVGLIKCNNE